MWEVEEAFEMLNALDQEDQTQELFRVESEYMKQKLQSEDDINRLTQEILEQID